MTDINWQLIITITITAIILIIGITFISSTKISERTEIPKDKQAQCDTTFGKLLGGSDACTTKSTNRDDNTS